MQILIERHKRKCADPYLLKTVLWILAAVEMDLNNKAIW